LTIADLFAEALRGVHLHRVRSLLTAAGFAAGTAAAIALFAITGGARAEILRRIEALGTDLVAVRPVGEIAKGAPPPLTYGDAEALGHSLPFVRTVAPVRALDSEVLLPTERVKVRVVGTTPDLFTLRHLRFRRGRTFTAEETARGDAVCVLGAATARRLVPAADAYGGLVKIGGNWYRIVGILAAESEFGAEFAQEPTGRDVYLPITHTFSPDAVNRQALAEAWLSVGSGIDPQDAAPVLERTLERRHEGQQHFEVATAASLLSQHRATSGLLNRLLLLVSIAAFASGGIGMMAVSWQNVRSRTREIAIRRALGARSAEVLAQFVLEGLVLAGAGAAVGIVAGTVASGGAAALAGWPWTLSVAKTCLTLAIALVIAVVSTFAPASYAARLDPVSALRLER
jgi:ABC-type antimicrobial peptide transport system permease subunit